MKNIPSKAHRHKIKLPGGREITTEYDYLIENPCWGADDELGFDPFSLISGGVGLVSNLLGGGKKGGGDASAAAPIALAPAFSELASKIVSEDALKNIVRNLLETIPSPVKEQMREVIKAIQAEGGSLKQAEAALVTSIEKKFLPQVTAAMEALKLAQTQREATSEHVSIMNDAKRWENNAVAQKKILSKQAHIQKQVAKLEEKLAALLANNMLLPNRAIPLAGGRAHLGVISR